MGIDKRRADAVSEPKPRGDKPGAVGVSTTAGRGMAAVDTTFPTCRRRPEAPTRRYGQPVGKVSYYPTLKTRLSVRHECGYLARACGDRPST